MGRSGAGQLRGWRLAGVRRRLGVTQAEVATRMGVTGGRVSAIGFARPPRYRAAHRCRLRRGPGRPAGDRRRLRRPATRLHQRWRRSGQSGRTFAYGCMRAPWTILSTAPRGPYTAMPTRSRFARLAARTAARLSRSLPVAKRSAVKTDKATPRLTARSYDLAMV